jgi:hypothetical protein
MKLSVMRKRWMGDVVDVKFLGHCELTCVAGLNTPVRVYQIWWPRLSLGQPLFLPPFHICLPDIFSHSVNYQRGNNRSISLSTVFFIKALEQWLQSGCVIFEYILLDYLYIVMPFLKVSASTGLYLILHIDKKDY